jgi:hypothetical protein
VVCRNYGGWGIYLDEGSSHVVVEGNVVHDVSSQAYHHHYGRESIIRHNVFAFGGQGQVSITRPERHVSFTLERNILVGRAAAGYVGTPGDRDVRNYTVVSDLNLFWDVAPIPSAVRSANGVRSTGDDGAVTFEIAEPLDEDWAAAGHDRHSVDADPLFVDLDGRDLRVQADSPAHALGIRVPDVTGAGPRPRAGRQHTLTARTTRDARIGAEALR